MYFILYGSIIMGVIKEGVLTEALWLYLVPAMCNRLVQEAGNKLQREESYKKMLLLRKQL